MKLGSECLNIDLVFHQRHFLLEPLSSCFVTLRIGEQPFNLAPLDGSHLSILGFLVEFGWNQIELLILLDIGISQ